jgi:Holliday junction resolvasome RuvABC ATP-dependent DNA helicase subunit
MTIYTAKNYLVNFIGQERLKKELEIYMEAMIHENLSLMIKGLSGYGKTFLSQIIFSYIFYKTETSFYYYLCEKDLDEIETDIRNLFLDEVHVIKEPEFLYPTLDSGKHNIVLATNEYYNLKEPLINRCIGLQIEEYTEENLAEISSRFFWKKNMEIPDEFAFRIAKVSRFPRETLSISKRLYIIFRSRGMPNSLENLNNIIKNTLGIDEKGNISLVDNYIQTLKSLGGQASITTLQNVLHLPKQVILAEIEPALLKRGIINISSKGRILNV